MNNKKKNQAVSAIENVLYNYADGVGENGVILSKFSDILNRYKKNYYDWSSDDFPDNNSYEIELQENKGTLIKKMLTALVVLVVLGFILFFLELIWYVKAGFFIASGIALGIASETKGWALPMILIFCPLDIIMTSFINDKSMANHLSGWIVLIYMGIFFIASLYTYVCKKSYLKRRSSEHVQKKGNNDRIEKELAEDKTKLIELLPLLKKEYRDVMKNIVSRYSDALTDEEETFYLNTELPDYYWWMISPQELLTIEKAFKYGGLPDVSASWHTEWYQRDSETAYEDAGEDYSPLYPIAEQNNAFVQRIANFTEEDDVSLSSEFYALLQLLACEKGNLYYVDFITSAVVSEIDSRTVRYQDYKYDQSKLDRADALNMFTSAYLLDSFKNGKITEEDYHRYNYELLSLDNKSFNMRNEKVMREKEEYFQVDTYTNIWSGQMLLIGEGDDNSDSFGLFDYRSQMYHVFRNLNSLEGINITRVYGDAITRNPIFLSKIHRVCPNCR